MKRLCLSFLLLLFANSDLSAQQPIKAPETFSKYKLSNIRIEDDNFGRANVVCDYRLVRKGSTNHSVRFVAKTEDGILNIMGSDHLFGQESGEIRLSKSMPGFGRNRKYNYEIYLVAGASWAGENFGNCMISNAVRIGNPGKATTARMMNAKEKAAYKKQLASKKPPTSTPPKGYELADLSSELLPGMYVMAGRFGEWEKAEIIGFDDQRKAKLRFTGETKVVLMPVEKWIAVDPTVIEDGRANPEKFKPSGVTLSEGTTLLPRDAVPLDWSAKLVPGTPLIYEVGSSWKEAVFTKRKGSKLAYRRVDFGSERVSSINKFAIRKNVLKQLGDPNIAELFAQNLTNVNVDDDEEVPDEDDVFPDAAFENLADNMDDDMRENFADIRNRIRNHHRKIKEKVKDYPIESPIPRNCQVVPDDLTIPKGTKVAACFHFDWSPATVLSDPGNGTLEVDWDDHNPVWNCRVSKNQMIIQNKSLKKIKFESELTPSKLSKMNRTWMDISGQHTIKAKFVSKTETEVTLLLDSSGKEKTIPINKLSEEDQKLLSKLKEEAANPFK